MGAGPRSQPKRFAFAVHESSAPPGVPSEALCLSAGILATGHRGMRHGRGACLPACSLAPAVGASSGRRHQPVEHWLRVITADNYVLDIVTMEFDIHGYKYEYNKIFMNNFFMVEYLVFIPVT